MGEQFGGGLGKHVARILKFLERHTDGCRLEAAEETVRLIGRHHSREFAADAWKHVVSAGLVTCSGKQWQVAPAGRSKLRRLLDPETGFAAQHGEFSNQAGGRGNHPAKLVRNLAESPLGRLYARGRKSGKAWLDAAQYQAGECLRNDFEKAGLSRRITVSWDAGAAGQTPYRDSSDIPDMAVDARKRVEKALKSLQPELAGLALDVCCFLKGLEQVERERQWPPRSAKVMLRTALDGLAEHYGLTGIASRRNRPILHWGAADYRPSVR